MLPPVSIFWFRRDLRFEDNVGLFHALHAGWPVVPVFIFDTDILDALENSDKRVVFIHKAVSRLQEITEAIGSTLDVRYGKPEEIFKQLLKDYAIQGVYTNHDYEPYARKRDKQIKELLQQHGISLYSFKDHVIFEKEEVVKPDRTPYFIFTPYAKKWRSQLTTLHYQTFESEGLLRQLFKQ
ncbi:MAG TPA: deoxyribodipyrimidine photo-lyase, partial [Flavisolibacter sp.]|nr:deoxyribodipyrimidine photo-lyase [Flavisolibacter sp.]